MPDDLRTACFRPIIRTLARTRLPKTDGELRLPGLEGPVEVLRDQWGIPHIYASERHDLFFAQGFVHAQDRLWQMDFNRRLTAGRLSEILGDVSLMLDRWMRILTIRRVAEFETSLLDDKNKGYLQSYANGVNAFLAQGKMPVEIVLLRYRPEPWIIADTLCWIKMMAWTLSVNWEAEILRALLIDRLGPERAAELEPPNLSRWPFVLPPGIDYHGINFEPLERLSKLRPFTGPSPYEGLGSNNWVLSGARTDTGMPLLANDMHLGMSSPSVWYENHLCTNTFFMTGVTFPGIPGVVSGHNGHVAWGFTNGFPDVQDLYMERLRRLPDGSVEAEYQGKWEQARILKESISIKDQKPVIQEVIITRHGPVINELASEITTGQPLALRWTALDPDTMIQCLPDLAQARTCQEFHHALKCWTTPAQNVVYADTAGDIGYTLAGKIPIRKKGNGRTPVPGWTDEYEWSEYIPFETLPHLENPPQGYVVTANNRVVGANYPFRMELEPITGDRAQRISELILNPETRHEGDKLSISYIKRMHFDLCSPSARVIARQLAQLPLQSSAHAAETELHAALKIIKDWDGELSAESTAAAIYQVFIRKLIWLIMHDKLDPPANLIESETTPLDPASIKSNATVEQIELTPRFMGKGPTPVLAESCLMGDRWLSWLTDITAHPDSPWFDLGHGETRDDVFHQAFQLTLEELTSRFGPEMKKWTWGALHQLTFMHPLGSNPVLASVFNIGPFPVGGDHTTVLATGSNYHNLDSSQIVGPPYRMIVDLGDLNNSISLLAPGQSGNPASPHFSDQVDSWFQGNYHPMLIDRLRIEESTRHTLKLIPMA